MGHDHLVSTLDYDLSICHPEGESDNMRSAMMYNESRYKIQEMIMEQIN